MASRLMSWIRKNVLLTSAIVIAIAGLIVLSLGARAVQPSPVSISNISSVKEGEFVSFLGVVQSVSPRDSGYSVAVCDSSSGKNCVSVLMARSIIPSTLIPGDYVTIRGGLKMYLGHMFVVPSQPADVTIVNPPSQ
jgi:DNA/RNA endonuclease YhcR with UshA esterase domain